MSLLDIKRFVDVNIVRHEVSSVNGSRSTVVVYHNGTKDKDVLVANNPLSGESVYDPTDTTLSANAKAFLNEYFANGGLKAYILKEVTNLAEDDIKQVGADKIVWVNTIDCSLSDIKTFKTKVKDFTGLKGIYKKIFICELSDISTSLEFNEDANDSFVVVTSHLQAKSVAGTYSGCAGFLAAYLSKINAYKSDQVYDYMYSAVKTSSSYPKANIDEIEDDFYGQCVEANVIPFSTLIKVYRSLGGNLLDGTDVVNEYMRILLHQTLTDRILLVLTKKIKNHQGIATLYSAICQELSKYVSNGYLTTDKVWLDEDLDIIYNGVTYNIIKKGTTLSAGFFVDILPLSSLSEEDRADRKTPPIHIILAEQYGIRKIEIDGEII